MDATRHARTVYVCPECHIISPTAMQHHDEAMIECDAGEPGDERSKPVFDAHGRLVTRAPRWWVETCIDTARARAKERSATRKPVELNR